MAADVVRRRAQRGRHGGRGGGAVGRAARPPAIRVPEPLGAGRLAEARRAPAAAGYTHIDYNSSSRRGDRPRKQSLRNKKGFEHLPTDKNGVDVLSALGQGTEVASVNII